ncbi:unnamed protein product [Euphydryas editha]|uniref:Peptidase S1 domain-containing protein n=1 Tax=Euphydryas editha TaxID=104508 RepID=A0AAU9UCX0_EUPED|nr:unnamed protein product [Euphydryas editha]
MTGKNQLELAFDYHVHVVSIRLAYSCERRIIDGKEVTSDKRYMVYLSKTNQSTRNYSWICGGAIISDWFVLTSAACIEDEKYTVVIWGYRNYVKSTDLDKHECTRNCKRIVTTFVPEDYQLTYNKVDEWSKLDIAIVKVEVPFDRPSSGCMYNPMKIPINFDIKYENASVDVIMLGWGHSQKWTEIDDKRDYNQNTLRYASAKIFNKEDCKKYFTKPDLSMLIDKYMICTYGESDLNDKGERSQRKYFSNSSDTLEFFKEKYENTTEIFLSQSNDNDEFSLRILNATRRQGICQNDHGGPLVTWINDVEHVIGVASVFRVNSQSECVPPFLFTSTARNKMFIECILGEEDDGRRSSVCNKPASERGFNILRTNVSWPDRHTSVTGNNVIYRRPQIPMNKYGIK